RTPVHFERSHLPVCSLIEKGRPIIMSNDFISARDPKLDPPRFAPLKVAPQMPHFSAEVYGVDLNGPLTDDMKIRLRVALVRYGVLHLRGQRKMSLDDQLAAASIFGKPDSG